MSEASSSSTYPEAPSKKHNDLAIELISGSVGGASQVIVGQVSPLALPSLHIMLRWLKPLDTLKTVSPPYLPTYLFDRLEEKVGMLMELTSFRELKQLPEVNLRIHSISSDRRSGMKVSWLYTKVRPSRLSSLFRP